MLTQMQLKERRIVMKQLGELAKICAVYPNAMMQIYNDTVSVHIGEGPFRKSLVTDLSNEMGINKIIYDLKYGEYAINRKENDAA